MAARSALALAGAAAAFAPSAAFAGDIVGETDLSYGKPPPSRDRIPSSGVAFDARFSFDAWVAGRTAGQSIGDVFTSGPAVQLDLGYILAKGLVLYGGWEHTFFGTGKESPYASLPRSDARGDLYMIGLRNGCGDPAKPIGLELSADVGYRLLRAEGSDDIGGSASISLGAVGVRPGAGLCIRPRPGLLVVPSLVLDASIPTGSYSGDVVSGGVQKDTSGSLATGSVMIAVSPGVSISGELPF